MTGWGEGVSWTALSRRTARLVLEDHLDIANRWVGEPFERILERGVFRGHEGVRQLAWLLAEELPQHWSLQHTRFAAEERIAPLEWPTETTRAESRTGVHSYLIEAGKVIAQTVHYAAETT